MMSGHDEAPRTAPLLLLGCRRQLVEACRALDRPVVVVYGPWEKDWALAGVGHHAARLVFVDEPARVDLVLAALAEHGLDRVRYAGVCPASDEYVVQAAVLASVLGVGDVDPRTTVLWRDKALQTAAVATAGVRTPRFRVIDDVLDDVDVADIAARVGFPAVLKPLAGAGTANTVLVADEGELLREADRLGRRSGVRRYLVEEFVPGVEMHLDGVVVDGVLEFLSLSDYVVTPLEGTHGRTISSMVLDPQEHAELYREANGFVVDVLRALGVTSSVFHVEAFRQDDGTLVFLECGVRLGGCFVPEMVRAKFGVDLAQVYVQLLCGTTPTIEVDVAPGVFCMMFLPTRPGVLVSCPSAAEVREQPGVVHAEVQKPAGSLLPPSSVNGAVRVGEALVVADDEAKVVRLVQDLAGWFGDRLTVAEDAGRDVPPAFRLWRRQAPAQ